MPPPRTSTTDARSAAYSAEFFDLQLRFARRAAALTGMRAAEAVGLYTNLYVRLSMGPRLDPGNAEWQQFLAGLAGAADPSAYAHAVHLRRLHLPAGPRPAAEAGCFSYEWTGADRARLHFRALEGESALAADRHERRLGELRALFAHLKAAAGGEPQIVGASWLYNLPAYRRLFPPAYLAGLRPIAHPYQRLPLWGQLLARDRTVRPGAASRFAAALAQAADLAALARCFALPVLATMAPARCFHDHLRL